MHKIVLIFLLVVGAFGFELNVDQAKELRILRELDISASFMHDPHYLIHKESFDDGARDALVGVIRERSNEIALIKKIISDSGLPRPLLYLAVVESQLNARATSGARAVGMWQFMERTAKNFGLRIDKYVDERKDPVQSTIAAMNYLSDMRGRLGKWYLALLAYNAGEARLKRAIKEAGSDELMVLIDPDKKYLPLETRNFIRKILTVAKIASDGAVVASEPFLLNRANRIDIVRVQVAANTHLASVSKAIGYDKLSEINRHIKRGVTPPKEHYYIYIPAHLQAKYNEKFLTRKPTIAVASK